MDPFVALGRHEGKEVDVADMGVELVLELEVVWIHLVLQHGQVEAEALLLHELPAPHLLVVVLPASLADFLLHQQTQARMQMEHHRPE